MTRPSLPPLWTHEETAAYLRVDPALLNRLVSAGAGPTRYWVGRHRRYDPALVATWLHTTTDTPAHPGRHLADPPTTTATPGRCGVGTP